MAALVNGIREGLDATWQPGSWACAEEASRATPSKLRNKMAAVRMISQEASVPQESQGAGVSVPSTSQRRNPPSIVGFNGPGSRANSGDSWPGEKEESDQGANRVPPPSTTASQWRGEDVTHSIALQLQRARQMLNVMVANPESTSASCERTTL